MLYEVKNKFWNDEKIVHNLVVSILKKRRIKTATIWHNVGPFRGDGGEGEKNASTALWTMKMFIGAYGSPSFLSWEFFFVWKNKFIETTSRQFLMTFAYWKRFY